MTDTSALPSYSELADLLGNLPLLLREGRRQRRLSLRGAAAEIGVGFTTLSRVENGEDTVLSTAVAILRWLDRRSGEAGSPTRGGDRQQ